MSVKVLAFFDTRFQTRHDGNPADPWQSLREARPVSRQYASLNWPSTLGTYDLSDPGQARGVVAMAAMAGINGFVVDVRPTDEGYATRAEPLADLTTKEFGLAFSWRNASDVRWRAARDDAEKTALLESLIGALKVGVPVLADGRVVLTIKAPDDLRDPAQTTETLRKLARRTGLGELYLIACRPTDEKNAAQGFDAALDPGPADWASCEPNNKPGGLEILEIQAGLRDSVELTDRFYHYSHFAIFRMMQRERRGKVIPRVFPSFQDWAEHPDGGATLLINRGASSSGSVDRFLYGLFLENAITYSFDHFAASERLVFLESWNHWTENSQIEPSLLDGDLVYNTTRDSIDKGRYLTRAKSGRQASALEPWLKERIDLLCEAVASANAPGTARTD